MKFAAGASRGPYSKSRRFSELLGMSLSRVASSLCFVVGAAASSSVNSTANGTEGKKPPSLYECQIKLFKVGQSKRCTLEQRSD